MKTLRFTFIGILLQTGLLYAQIPVRSYHHLTGITGDGIEMILELIKVGDSLYGNGYFRQREDITTDQTRYPFSPVYFQGKIHADRMFNLTVIEENKISLSGRWPYGNQFTVTWEGFSGQPVTVQLDERYTEGSIPLNVYFLSDVKHLSKIKSEPAGKIDLAILLPGESENQQRTDTLRSIILKSFHEKSNGKEAPEGFLEAIRDKFFMDYTESNEDLYLTYPDAGALNWQLIKGIRIIHNQDGILCFSVFTYAYTGGAHGLESQSFVSVDTKSAKLLSPDDLLNPGYEVTLSILLTQKLAKMVDLAPGQKLSDAGYFVDEVKTTGNFFMTSNGIGFHYDPYEIAPYAFGSTDIFIPYTELGSLLR